MFYRRYQICTFAVSFLLSLALVFGLSVGITSFISDHAAQPLSFLASSVGFAGTKMPLDYVARNLATITKIYDTSTYPNNLAILQNGSAATPPGLFNQNAAGRVTPFGNFSGFEESTEYFFALNPIPGETGVGILRPNYNTFTSISLPRFSSQCPEVVSSVVYLHTTVYNPGAANHGEYVTSLKEIAFWRFDDEGAVLFYDAWVPNVPLWAQKHNSGVELDAKGFVPTVVHEAAIATNLCPQIMDRCKGPNQQYNNLLSCIVTLSAKPFGSFDEMWGDKVVCRLIHIALTRVRPDVHCPHVGPTGGGKCEDNDYNSGYFADDEALFGRGEPFICPKK